MRGGAREYIGNLTPEITDATSLEANCDCFYVSAHGTTDLSNLMIVPENTFVVFVGLSGFTTPVKHGAEWLFHAPTREAYFQGIYDTYFTQGAAGAKKRPYAGEHVYVPGDVLPMTNLSFSSGTQPFWFKGVYQCPVADPKMFSIPTEMSAAIQIAELSKPGALKDSTAIMSISSAINDFGIIKDRAAWEAFVALHLAYKIDMVTWEPEKGTLEHWFRSPQYMDGFTDFYLRMRPDNLNLPFNRLGNSQKLGTILIQLNTMRAKPYKFIIVSSCRQPTNFMGPQISLPNRNKRYAWTNPNNLPANTNTTRRLARRFSFSGKPAEICATTDDPPMNINGIRRAVYVMRPKPVTPATPEILIGDKEDSFIDEILTTLTNRFGTHVDTGVSTVDFLRILNRAFAKYPILEDDRPEQQAKRAAFTNVIMAIKSAFGAFLAGVHMDSTTEEKRAHTLGRQMLEQALLLSDELREVNEANIIAAQKAFVEDPKWAALTGKREAAVKKVDAVLAGLPPRQNSFSLTTRVTMLEDMLDYYLTNDILRGLERAEGVEKEIQNFFPAFRKSVEEFKAAVAEVAPLVGEKYTQEILRLDAIIHMLETKELVVQAILKQLREKQAEQARIPTPPTRSLPPPALPQPLPATLPKWNEKELLKWRVEWLMGIKNPARNAVRLKQWSAYRQTLTEEERKAQNANLKIKATRKNRVNKAGNRNVKTAKNKKAPGGGKSKTFTN